MSSICFFLDLLFNSARRSCDCRITSANRFFESSRGGFFSMGIAYTRSLWFAITAILAERYLSC